MLRSLAARATNWGAKIILGLLVASFGLFWGVTDIFKKRHPLTAVATVGGTELLTTDFQHQLAQRISHLEKQMGRRLSANHIIALGIPSAVLSHMINQSLLDKEIGRLRLTITDAQVLKIIHGDSHFWDQYNRFDPEVFKRVLKEKGVQERKYVALLRQAQKYQQLVGALSQGVSVPKPMEELILKGRLQKRSGVYAHVAIKDQKLSGHPDALKIQEFFNESAEDFRMPQRRSFTYVWVDPLKLSAASKKAEQDSKARIDDIGQEVDDLLASGGSLEEALAIEGVVKVIVKDIDGQGRCVNGTLHSSLPSDVSFREAILKKAFSSGVGEDNALERASGGQNFVLRVDHVTPSAIPPLADVKPRVQQVWKKREQRRLAGHVADAHAKRIREGGKPDNIFQNMPPVSLATLSQDKGMLDAVKQALFRLNPGEVRVVPGPEGFYVVKLVKVEQPMMPAQQDSTNLKKSLQASLQDDYLQAYTSVLRSRYPVLINQAAMQAVSRALAH